MGDLPEPLRSRYEDRYVEAIREVGGRLLAAGDLPGAWPYFRAIAEREPVAEAIEAYAPAAGDERVGAVIDVAFNQAAGRRRTSEPRAARDHRSDQDHCRYSRSPRRRGRARER